MLLMEAPLAMWLVFFVAPAARLDRHMHRNVHNRYWLCITSRVNTLLTKTGAIVIVLMIGTSALNILFTDQILVAKCGVRTR